jgi:transcription-repair coupling factor (superfamily II helicase)
MDLPKLVPGRRYTLPRPAGSADSLLLAQLATREKAARRLTAIITADATDAQRLIDEMAFFAPDLRCALFPDWETLPYDTFSPHQDLISERLATLWRIQQRDKDTGADVVVVPATTALYRLAPPAFLAGYTFHFKVKQKLDEARLKGQLTLAGYSHVTQVVSPGEYAVRGGLIDLFPMGSPVPYRVDLFDDEIDSIRTFDPDSQRSLYPVPEVRLLPGREFPMDDAARAKFRSRWRELLEGDPTKSRIYKDIGNGVATAGIEYYLPLFFDDTATVFDYLGADATVVLHGDLEPAFQHFWQDTKERYRLVQGDPERPVLPPEACSWASSPSTPAPTNTPSSPFGRPSRTWPTTPTSRNSATSPSCAAQTSRWPGCRPTCAPRHTACCSWPRATADAKACSTSCAPAASARRPSTRWPNSRPAPRRSASPPPR